jgi:hypothetical protein
MVAFIVMQPVIDILTTATLLWTDMSISIGIVLRTLYFLLMATFILYMAFHSKHAKWYLAYLVGLLVLLIANVYLNMQVKNPYYLIQELTFFNKAIYFHLMFFGFLLIVEQLKKNGTDVKKQLIRMFLTSSLIISAVFIISQLTNTSMQNYARSKEGWTGWFYAGNEIGAIMSILLPITMLYAVQKTNKWSDVKYWAPFVALSVSMLALGTKVGYGGIIVVLLSTLIGSLALWVWKKHSTFKMNSIISALLLAVLIAVTPFTPVFNNMYAHFGILGIDFSNEEDPELGQGEEPSEEDVLDEESTITGEQFQNLVFSSREEYAKNYEVQFAVAPTSQKLIGMGFAGNYDEPTKEEPIKIIEMDFHDFFYSFGILGFIYVIAPLIYFAGKYLIDFVINLKTRFNYFAMFTGISFLLGTGISYTAGHVLTAPSVSIYLAALLAVLVVTANGENSLQNDKSLK